jgi:predicted lipoprotein with Yx(FWY)xxD motif
MRFRTLAFAPLLVVALVAGCSSSGSSPSVASQAPASVAPASVAPASVAPASVAPASVAPASAPASAAAGAATVEAKPVGSIGMALVAANGMTVYVFSKDVKDSGKSACGTGCIDTWPALTVAAGAKPAGGTGVTGKLGTITRDDGTLQVTYNGLPLYFFKNDHAPGDANGVYTNWEAVKP